MSSTSDQSHIADLEVGTINQTLLLTGAAIHETRSGDPYLRCTLQDKTGELPAVKWDTDDAPEPGLYQVDGFAELYKGAMQVKINGIDPADGDLSEYIRSTEIDTLEEGFDALLGDLGGEYGDVARCIFADDEIREAFFTAPAATKNHHAFRGGLAEHTLSMCEAAARVSTHYRDTYGDDVLDPNLLLAGTLLHDLGKIFELEQDGVEWKRQARGELVGHISECVAIIHDACLACLASQDTRDRLIHMVLSHHGKREWGSPVEPRLVEAHILHCIDMMDSRVAMCREATEGLSEGELSGKVWALGGRVVR